MYVGFTEDDFEEWDQTDDGTKIDDFVCSVPVTPPAQSPSWTASDPEWWFMWWGDQTMPICKATDMKQAAQVITAGLESAPGA